MFGEELEFYRETINLTNVSHTITDVFLKGFKIYGKINFLDTPSGRILKEFIKGRFKIKTKIRVTGSTHNGITEIADILTWDVVPSEEKISNKEYLGWNVII